VALTELILSDITRMGHGFCVIGIERDEGGYRSIRPLPPYGDSWPLTIPFRRGDVLQFDLNSIPVVSPHIEDRRTQNTGRLLRHVSEDELVTSLRQAETSCSLEGLFGCEVQENQRGSGIFLSAGEGRRSICGCEINNFRFEVFPEEVRALALLSSGLVLRDFPLVDRDWRNFIDRIFQKTSGANRIQRIQRFLNKRVTDILMKSPSPFARIGVTRIHNNRHWLMLDSLFPLPQEAWFDDLQ
jgi:hypothetical protein